MANCCAHDWVDWIGAFGPTLATVFAGAATISVYRRGERFQRQLVRPLVVVRQQINPAHEVTRWIVSLKNEGQGAANIETFTVVANEIIEPEPLQQPAKYWEGVMYALGILRVKHVDGWQIVPPVSLGSGAELPLFDAYLQGEGPDVEAAIKKLEIRIHGHSTLSEPFVIRHRYGHNE